MRIALLLAALALPAARAQAQPHAWSYPRAPDRRDPVIPPEALYTGDGFPELRVHSIAHDPTDPRDSRALVVLTGTRGGRSVVRAGDRVGQYRVLAVQRRCLVALQNVLGSGRRIVLCLPRPGGARP
ncbi:MAG TPA: hypothetical protein VF613_13875 [Longimicrobium sp.]|jgi:hypothetical protein